MSRPSFGARAVWTVIVEHVISVGEIPIGVKITDEALQRLAHLDANHVAAALQELEALDVIIVTPMLPPEPGSEDHAWRYPILLTVMGRRLAESAVKRARDARVVSAGS
jgi:hypothetical protein